jgi:hypothetical protein
MLEEINIVELYEWMGYAALEPFDEQRADLRAAIITATIANTARDRKKRPKPFAPKDFMLKFEGNEEPKPKQQDTKTMLSIVKQIVAGHNAKPQEQLPL